jgi:hypothetical protein
MTLNEAFEYFKGLKEIQDAIEERERQDGIGP